jgi:hypothetical protein
MISRKQKQRKAKKKAAAETEQKENTQLNELKLAKKLKLEEAKKWLEGLSKKKYIKIYKIIIISIITFKKKIIL